MKLSAIALTTILLATASTAIAQSRHGDMTVDVPFPFVAAGADFPAGHYLVKDVDSVYVRIYSAKTKGVFAQTHFAQRAASGDSKLVFRCYSGSCFLAEVWVKGETGGRELFRTRSEQVLVQRNAEMKLAEVRPLK